MSNFFNVNFNVHSYISLNLFNLCTQPFIYIFMGLTKLEIWWFYFLNQNFQQIYSCYLLQIRNRVEKISGESKIHSKIMKNLYYGCTIPNIKRSLYHTTFVTLVHQFTIYWMFSVHKHRRHVFNLLLASKIRKCGLLSDDSWKYSGQNRITHSYPCSSKGSSATDIHDSTAAEIEKDSQSWGNVLIQTHFQISGNFMHKKILCCLCEKRLFWKL